MPKFKADSSSASEAQNLLIKHGHSHLRTRHRADVVTIESGAPDDVVAHARLRRVSVHLWLLDIANHRGKWEPTLVRSTLPDCINTLAQDFGWVLELFEEDPLRTSDQEH
jgi:hypothetical protein